MEFATRLRDQRAKLSEAITRCEMEMQIIRQQTMFNARLQRELSIANQRISQLEEMVRQMLQSTSWRLTAPLRFAMLRFRLTAIGRCFGQFGKR